MPTIFLPMSFSTTSNIMQSLTLFMHYAIQLIVKQNAINILFIGTANNDSYWDKMFFKLFLKAKFGKYCNPNILNPTLLSGSEENKTQLKELIAAQDIIFVGGGNTLNMLEAWKKGGLVDIFNGLVHAGDTQQKTPIIAGVSAGGMFPFESGLTDSYRDCYATLSCQSYLKGSFSPHLNSEERRLYKYTKQDEKFRSTDQLSRQEAFDLAAQRGDLHYPCYGVPDDVMLVFIDGAFKYAYSAGSEKEIHIYHSANHSALISTQVLKTETVLSEAFRDIESSEAIVQPRTCRLL